MSQLRPLMANDHEVLADRELGRAAEAAGYRVAPKVRLAAVLPIDRRTMPADEYRFAVKADFDFLVTEGDERRPQFAVEFVWPGQAVDPALVARATIKEAICSRLGLPLLRIDGTLLRRVQRRSLVGLLVEAWSTYQGFLAAQEAGEIPWGEPWCYFSVYDVDPETGRMTELLAVDGPGRALIHDLYGQGVMKMPAPSSLIRFGREPIAESFAMIELADGRFLTGDARVRNFRFAPISAHELVEDLAIENLRTRIELWRAGQDLAVERAEVERIRAEHPKTAGWNLTGLLHEAWA